MRRCEQRLRVYGGLRKRDLIILIYRYDLRPRKERLTR